MDNINRNEIITKLVDEININLGCLPAEPMEEFTIFRMPAHIRQKNKELYEPKMVSIGPYYNGNDALLAMEKHKWKYLKVLSENAENDINNCVHALSALEARARSCYFEAAMHPTREFLMMMLLDGCFIIEFITRWHHKIPDTISAVNWADPIIQSDLLLSENQIPFFVIETLFNLLTFSRPVPANENTIVVQRTPLVIMLSDYLSEGNGVVDVQPSEIKHILHLYYCCYMTDLRPITRLPDEKFPRTIPSATELKEAGIIFKCKQSENIFDITFQNGTLEIPFITIEETQRPRLSSLLSFEQFNGEDNNNLTSYACFMGHLFKNARDVTLLQEMGILDNLLATNDELVSFLNWLTECSYLDYNKHYLKELFRDVNEYYISNWHRWFAILKRKYFSNPWSFISLAAAFALLALTVLQTVYTMLSYFHRK